MTRRNVFGFIFLCLFSVATYSKDTLVIALDADMSAVAKEGGVAIERGALIAINEINKEGGILGRQLELKIFDHRGNPARGIANIKKISKLDNLLAVLGGVHTPVVLQELPLIHEHEILFMAPWSAGTPIIDNGYEPNFAFRVSVRDQEAGKVLVGAAKKKGLTKIALLLEKTGWGRSNLKSMTAAAEEHGIEITTTQWINWKQKDMSSEIEAIAESGAQAMMLVANAPEGAIAVKAVEGHPKAKELRIFSHWGLAGGNFVKMASQSTLNQVNLFVLQSYSFAKPHDKEKNQKVLNLYRDSFDPNTTTENMPGAVGVAHSYDIIHLLKAAAESANSVASNEMRVALENLDEFNGLVKKYTPPFTKDRHDALWSPDYFLSRFDSKGQLIPVQD